MTGLNHHPPSLATVQRAILNQTIPTLVEQLESIPECGKKVAAAVRMQAPLLSAHPQLAFPILYDRLIWEHGPASQSLQKRRSSPQPALHALLQQWRKEHGQPWMRSLLPPPHPLTPPGLRSMTVSCKPQRLAFSPDGAVLVWTTPLYQNVGAMDARSGHNLGTLDTHVKGTQVRFVAHDPRTVVLEDDAGQRQYFCVRPGEGLRTLTPEDVAALGDDPPLQETAPLDNLEADIQLHSGGYRLGVGTPAQIRAWAKASSRWARRWKNGLERKAYAWTSLSEDGTQVAWRMSTELNQNRLFVVRCQDAQLEVVSTRNMPRQPDDGPMFAKNGRQVVFNGRNDFYHDCDYVSVVRIRDGRVLMTSGHRSSAWHDLPNVPTLAATKHARFSLRTVGEHTEMLDEDGETVVMIMDGRGEWRWMQVLGGPSLLVAMTKRRRGIFRWEDA